MNGTSVLARDPRAPLPFPSVGKREDGHRPESGRPQTVLCLGLRLQPQSCGVPSSPNGGRCHPLFKRGVFAEESTLSKGVKREHDLAMSPLDFGFCVQGASMSFSWLLYELY